MSLEIVLTDSASTSPSSGLGEELSADMTAAIADYGQTFNWRGANYACVVNWSNSTLLVAKSYFPTGIYPARGESIIIAGKNRVVLKLNNSALSFNIDGVIEDRPFIDDPGDPALLIQVGRITETHT